MVSRVAVPVVVGLGMPDEMLKAPGKDPGGYGKIFQNHLKKLT